MALKLPDFIYKAVSQHNTSVGNNDAFPQREDVSFDYIILKHRFKQIIEEVEKQFGYVPTVVEAENMLNKFIYNAIKIETPLRPQLEKLCEAIVNNVLGIPQETILLDCELVDKVSPDNEIRIMPEDDEDEPTYTFDDVDELQQANKVILKRRLINTLVQGASYLLMTDFYDNEQVNEWSEELEPLYAKIIALNDYLLFVKKEKISDTNPMLGAYVETHLGKGDEKTVISAQGLIFPLLLQETFRGFFELFASHGLPQDTEKANYIIHHADFLMAEAWDLRVGVPLWERIEGCSDIRPLGNMYPYIFSALVQQKVREFNDTMKNIFAGTNKGKNYLNNIINQIRHDDEYNLFKQDIQRFNLEKCVINDDDGEDSGDIVTEEDSNDSFVHTDSFKSWFGDWESGNMDCSYVVGSDGHPIPCYHSTQKDFEQFDPDRIGSGGAGCYHGFGFNFTTLPNTSYGSFVKKAYLNARHPLSSLKKEISLKQLVKILLEIDKGEMDTIATNFTGNYVKIGQNGYLREIESAAKEIYEYAENDLDIYANICTASNGEPKKVIEVFSRLGYDSSCEYNQDGRLSVVVVFHTEQIMFAPKSMNESVLNENKYDQEFNDITSAYQAFVNEKAKEYGNGWHNLSWMKFQHPEIYIKPEDEAKLKELQDKLTQISHLWSQANDDEIAVQQEEEEKRKKEYYSSEQFDLMDLAKEEFGTTRLLSQAGYVLPDGSLLNLGQGGDRTTDHRAIEGIYKANDIEIWNDEYRYNYVVDFLNHGAIRIDASTGVIDMTMEPTDAEYRVLKDIVRRTGGEAYVDFTDKQGDTICSVEYDHVSPQRLVADIKRYFQEGIHPLGDVNEGKRRKVALKEGVNFDNWFQGSKVVNSDGSPKLMYRGDGNQIDSFDRSYSKTSNLYGTGFYFTDSKAHASQYGNIQSYYLRIVHPLSTDRNEITKQQLYKFLVAVDKNEDYGLYNYGQGSTPKTVLRNIWGKSDFAMLQDINVCCIGDLVEATLLFNQVNNTDFDGFILDTETVVFDNNQIRKANESLQENRIITEGISDITYHYCSLESLYNILKDGKIGLTMSTNMADAYHKTKLFYLSTQRSKNPNLGYAGNSTQHGKYSTARVELDGYLLKQDGYQGMPLDYWGAPMGKQSDIGLQSRRLSTNYNGNIPDFDDEDKKTILKSQGQSSNFEFEDRIFSNKPSLPLKYVKRIDCYMPGVSINGIDKAILELADKRGIFVAFYTTEKDFVMQTDNLSNEVIKDSESDYKSNIKTTSENDRQQMNAENVAILSAALMYYQFYDNMDNGHLKEDFYDKLQIILQKFGLEQYFDYCKENVARITMWLERYIGTSLEDSLRKANTNSITRNNLSENVMLYAQYVLNHYNVNNVSALRAYFKSHPWKERYNKPETIQETVKCVLVDDRSIYRADDKSFWERFFDKSQFYDEIERLVDEDDWNISNGYNDRNIYYKSKDSNSFKKYLQHLIHNDNLSLYDGVVILNKIVHNNQEIISTMFGLTIQPIELNKDTFIENENKINWNDQQSITKSLFGSEDGYYAYRWPKTNESRIHKNGEQLNEYLDKDYMKPLFDYLKNGNRYSSGGYYNASKRLVVPFFEWARTQLDETEWRQFANALKNCKDLKGKIRPNEFMGHRTIDCYSQTSDGLKQVPTKQFLKGNEFQIFRITYTQDPVLSQFWDKFMTQFINTEKGDRLLSSTKSLDADTVLMNPELKKPQWLIHLTPNRNDALNIVQNGFQYGLDKNQMPKLGYTNNGIDKESKKGKYLYAFNAEEIAEGTFPTNFIVKDKSQHKYEKPFDQKTWEYASQFAIMFTAPGIQAFHGTDKQNQVIFNADMAHNFVLLTRNKDFAWQVNTVDGKIVYKNNSLTEIVSWVINNFSQYRKRICQKI